MTEYTPEQIRQAAAVVRALEPGDEASLQVEFRLSNWADRIETTEQLIETKAEALFKDLYPDQGHRWDDVTVEQKERYRNAVREFMTATEGHWAEEQQKWSHLSEVPESVNKVYDKDGDTVIRATTSPFGWEWISYTMDESEISGLAPYTLKKK